MGLEKIFARETMAVLSASNEEQLPLFPPDEEQLELPLEIPQQK